ncbi:MULTISPECIES: helix-turn-helix domain-containing protein [Streptomyces]|nr:MULTISPECIES: helix-turn-helix domain-containing protein [Streptomyces]MCL7364880.1 TetR/AcrR family transcriptional regulator [Streptomyces ardesiacus]
MIQTLAVRMFVERGYDATTVADIAEAAGVAPMTVYRHFPTKEDLVLVDQNGPLVAEHIAATSPAQPLVRRIGSALVAAAATLTGGARPDDPATGDTFLLARLQLMISTPALRARHLDSHYALQQAIVDALADDATDPDAAFRARAAAGACLAAMHTALVRWAEDDGRTELPGLIVQALVAAFGADAVDVDPAG